MIATKSSFVRTVSLAGRFVQKALIDLVAANAAEVVALRREEETLERLLRRLAVGRIARTQQRVDLAQRFFFSVRRILRQRVLDEHRLGAARGDEHLDLA